MEETTKAPAMSAEQAADLAALSMAAAVPAPGAPVAEPEPARPDLADEIKALVLSFVAIATPILPSLGRIYTGEVTTQAAVAIAGVCRKRGWLSDGVMGDYGEEIAAAVVLLPLGFATMQGVRGDIAAMNSNRKPAEIAAPAGPVPEGPAPGSDTVTFGAVIPAEPEAVPA